MKLLLKLLLSLASALVLANEFEALGPYAPFTPGPKKRLVLLENPGAKYTLAELKKRSGAAIVIPAGYFYPIKPTRLVVNGRRVLVRPSEVDLVMINGTIKKSYLHRKGRPILATNRRTGKIALFNRYSTYLRYKSYFTDAAAGDHRGQDIGRACYRTVIAFDKRNRCYPLRLWGTAKQVKELVRAKKLRFFTFFDSGTSSYPSAKPPSYWAVLVG